MSAKGGGDASGRGRVPVKVNKSKKRTVSSRSWLQRQLNDPYVAAARAKGYRSRAAFKLKELDDRFHLLRKGQKVLDLGAAPRSSTRAPFFKKRNLSFSSISLKAARLR